MFFTFELNKNEISKGKRTDKKLINCDNIQGNILFPVTRTN